MADLLLVHPAFLAKQPDEVAAASPYFPLGLLYLAGWVRARGHRVEIFDATFEPDETSFLRHLERFEPDVVGISALVTTAEAALDLAGPASAAGALTVLGGPDPTTRPDHYAAHPSVDLVIHHEGEVTLARVLDLVDAGELTRDALLAEAGVALRDGSGAVVVTPPRPPIDDLDSLADPARDLIDLDRHLAAWRDVAGYSSLTIATSRGCPRGCRWCRDGVHGAGFRQRSPEHVAAEVAAVAARYDVDCLRLVDDVDGIDRAWFERWAGAATARDAALPFEALYDPQRRDLPLLEVRDSL